MSKRDGARAAGTPVWGPALFLYPLRGYALVLILMFGSILWLATFSLLGLPALIVFGAWSLAYAFSCAEQTALGRCEPPELDFSRLSPFDGRLAAAVLFGAGAVGLPVLAGVQTGPGAAMAVSALLSLLFPAHLVAVGVLDRPLDGINPLRLTQIALALGGAGLVTAILWAAIAVAVTTLAARVPGPFLFIALLYAAVLVGHLAGIAAYRHRETLGLAPVWATARTEATGSQQALDGLFDEVRNVADSKHAAARLMAAEPPAAATDITAWRTELFRHFLAAGHPAAEAFGRALLQELVANGRLVRLLALLDMGADRLPALLPSSADDRLQMARFCEQAKRSDLALRILDGADGREPGEVGGELALLRARLLIECEGDEAGAARILAQLATRADPALAARVRALRRLIRNRPVDRGER